MSSSEQQQKNPSKNEYKTDSLIDLISIKLAQLINWSIFQNPFSLR